MNQKNKGGKFHKRINSNSGNANNVSNNYQNNSENLVANNQAVNAKSNQDNVQSQNQGLANFSKFF